MNAIAQREGRDGRIAASGLADSWDHPGENVEHDVLEADLLQSMPKLRGFCRTLVPGIKPSRDADCRVCMRSQDHIDWSDVDAIETALGRLYGDRA